MKECYSCGITEDKAILYEGVHKALGVVRVCSKCYNKEKIPLIDTKKVSEEVLVETRPSVRERLIRMSGLRSKEKEEPPKRHVFTPEDIGLKEIVDKNIEKEIKEGPKESPDLIDNWNWIIMRKRRSMKLSYSQLGDEIKEQPIILEALEKGTLPRDYVNLIKKLENYLKIRLFKVLGSISVNEIITESKVPSGILISEIKNKTEEKTLFSDNGTLDAEELDLDKIRQITGEPEEKKEEKKDVFQDKNLDELTDEEINDLIFGRKK
jgi:ribosome-binding protein aMBF1 (putative translation factor)